LPLKDIDQCCEVKKMRRETLMLKERVFGYTEEEIEKVIGFMADNSQGTNKLHGN
jgi:glutamate synthase (NADPH/NADH) large chain